jgi:predicted ATPase/class 3 adenylate cyclase
VDLPSGVVTFLMTDIEGSTRLWEEAPDAMRAALARHDAIAAHVVAGHAGFVIKPRGEGDSTFSVFARATDAVHAARALQSALAEEPWPDAARLRVRVAVHTGEADLGVDDYYGTAVNRCARLRSIAHGGQVLVSEATAGLVREMLPEELSLRDLGHQRLRDLAEPERVSQLLHPSLPSDFPALRTIDLVPNNLPYQVSTFVGREAEMTKIRELLRGTRLLTLTGAGGVGKTRLALQAAAEMLYEYPDGVWLVDLAALSDADLVPQSLASALGVREEAGRPLADTLVAHLRNRQSLLILDNCEHLVDASAGFAEGLTRRCAGVTILATSREALRAEGETVWRVPSLSVPHPQPGVRPQPQQLTQYAAVRLFIDRAMKASPSLTVTSDSAPAVAEICSRLDGVPLAIELAASRTRALSPAQIEQRLSERFTLLTGGRRTALPRQQTLEATVAWSYELLPGAEKLFFSRLSVFAGGFTLEAAEAVCCSDDVSATHVADAISELVAKSLVIPGKGRYWMLETLRAYGTGRLEASGEADDLCAQHAAFISVFAAQAKAGMAGPEQADWLRRVDAELGNVRAALAWGLGHDQEAGLALMLGLGRFWDVRGYWTEGRQWLSRFLGSGDAIPPALRANALVLLGALTRMQGDLVEARDALEEALTLSRRGADPVCTASALHNLGNVAAVGGDYCAARSYFEECLGLRMDQGDQGPVATTLMNLGNVAMAQGRYDESETHYVECLRLCRELGDAVQLSTALNNLMSPSQMP